jgi:hypothetical protein
MEVGGRVEGDSVTQCSQNAESIHHNFSNLANMQPETGYPSTPPLVAYVKRKKAINVRQVSPMQMCY